jgi:hypothetical protein
MTRNWPEGNGLAGHGPTWYCADDQDTTLLGNAVNDCLPGNGWGMEPWQSLPMPFSMPPTDTQSVVWLGTRSVRFDVTADVRRYIAGEPNHGWIVKGTEDLLSGQWVNFGSRESGAPPTLLLTFLDDRCPDDDQKTDEGICGCGVPDVDADSDGIMDCVDPCLGNSDPTAGGQCGCPDVPVPAGTSCTDAPCGAGSCDGAGHCVAHSAECLDTFQTAGCAAAQLTSGMRVVCSGATSWEGAQDTCGAFAGMQLAQIDSIQENSLLSSFLTSPAWTGGNDRSVEGIWRWESRLLADDGPQFWQGGPGGSPYFGRFANWSRTEPGGGPEQNCLLLQPSGFWSDEACNGTYPFLCTRNGVAPGDHAVDVPPGCAVLGQSCERTDYSECTPTPEGVPELVLLPNDDIDNSQALARMEACQACQDPLPADQWEAQCTPPVSDACSGSATPPEQGARCDSWRKDLPPEHEFVCRLTGITTLNFCSAHGDCNAGEHCGLLFVCDATASVCSSDADCPSVGGQQGYCRGLRLCGTPDPSCPTLDIQEERCGETLLCPEESEYNTELIERPFDPATQFCDAAQNCNPSQPGHPDALPPDPPCLDDQGSPLAVCPNSPSHLWCHYDVPQELSARDVSSPGSEADAGTDQVGFYFDPSIGMHYEVEPGPLALLKFRLGARARLTAGARLGLFGINSDLNVVDVNANIDAGLFDREDEEICGIRADAHAKLFDLDLVPSSFGISEPGAAVEEGCIEALQTWGDRVARMRKAYSDARELLRQYHALDATENFGVGAEGLCELLVNDPPQGFPPGDCATEAPEDTINRFIEFYHAQVDALKQGGIDDLAGKVDAAFTGAPDFGEMPSGSEEVALFSAVFFVGPIPCTMQIVLVTSYGFSMEPIVSFKPGATFRSMLGEASQYARANDPFAKIGISGGPGAGASIGMFVGAGIDAGPVGATLGVMGSVELGRLSFPVDAAAGIAVASTADNRHLEGALPPEIDPTYVKIDSPAFPPKRFHLEAIAQYGAGLEIRDLLSGDISLRLKLKFFFFSKVWRRQVAQWSGLCPTPNGHFHEWCDTNVFGERTGVPIPIEWGTVQMPTTLFRLEPIREYRDPGTVPASLDRVGEFLYDSLCTCRLEDEECYRPGDCCDDAHLCFTEDATGRSSCSGCRGELKTCNDAKDCCDPSHRCSADVVEITTFHDCDPDMECLDPPCFCTTTDRFVPSSPVCQPASGAIIR